MDVSTKLVRDIVVEGKRRRLSQAEIARRAGTSPEQLSRLLAGSGGARVDTLANLASVVGWRVALVPDDDFAADLLSGKLIDLSEDEG